MVASSEQSIDYSTLSNKELGFRIKLRDPEVLAEIDRRFGDEWYRYALKLAGKPEDAQDIWQETLLRINLSGHLYDESYSSPHPWISTIVKNIARDFYRKNRKHRRAVSTASTARGESDLVSIQPSREKDIARIREVESEARSVRSYLLKRQDRPGHKVMYLFCSECMTYREIAKTLGIPEGTVRSRMHAVRKEIRAFFDLKDEESYLRTLDYARKVAEENKHYRAFDEGTFTRLNNNTRSAKEKSSGERVKAKISNRDSSSKTDLPTQPSSRLEGILLAQRRFNLSRRSGKLE